MSVAGLKNKFAKAGQYTREKVLKADHTQKDEEYQEMEKAVDALGAVTDQMVKEVARVLMPNPTERMKILAKKRVKSDKAMYPYEEGPLGDVMLKAAPELSEKAAYYAGGLETVGNAMRDLADERDNLTVIVGQNFIDPLCTFLSRDVKEIQAHRKKLESRRLTFDAKKRKVATAKGGNSGVTEDELREAEAKYEESYDLASESMANLLECESEHLAQLRGLMEAMADAHSASLRILEGAIAAVQETMDAAGAAPPKKRAPRPSRPSNDSPPDQEEPYCVALFDFEPENDNELGFGEGAVITLVSRVDDNWLEGELDGKTGYFPTNYVEVKVDI